MLSLKCTVHKQLANKSFSMFILVGVACFYGWSVQLHMSSLQPGQVAISACSSYSNAMLVLLGLQLASAGFWLPTSVAAAYSHGIAPRPMAPVVPAQTTGCDTQQPLHVVTTISHAFGDVCAVLGSAAHHNLTMKVFGWGSGPKQWGSSNKGTAKLMVLRKALDSLPPDDLMLGMDGSDIFFNKGKEGILAAYCALNHSLVFSSEKFCWPCPPGEWPASPSPYRHLNAGGFLGRVRDVQRFIGAIFEQPTSRLWMIGADQGEAQRVFLERHGEWDLGLDYNQTIWQSMFKAQGDFCGPGLTNCLTGAQAAAYHFNGWSKRDAPQFLRRLGWYHRGCPMDAPLYVNGELRTLGSICMSCAPSLGGAAVPRTKRRR